MVFVVLLDQLLVQLLGRLVAVAHDEALHTMVAHRDQVVANRLKVILHLKIIKKNVNINVVPIFFLGCSMLPLGKRSWAVRSKSSGERCR